MHPDDARLFAGEINRQCAGLPAKRRRKVWYEAWAEGNRIIVRNVWTGHTQTLESVAHARLFIAKHFA